MNNRSYINIHVKQKWIISILFFLLPISLLFAILIGSTNISIFDFLNNNYNEIQSFVLFEIRIPRVFLACFVGAALSISGSSLQGIFRNPLADPGLIGVSAGAALGAALSIVIGSYIFPEEFSHFIIPFSAIIGSIIVILILFFITKNFRHNSIIYLLLSGIAINAFAGVGIGILTYISDESALRGITFWSMGSFGGSSSILIFPSIIIIFFIIIYKLKLSKELDIIQLGEKEALRLGVNIRKLKTKIIILSAIIVGISVSLSGMIGFVGLIVPHIVRLLGGSNHFYVLLSSALAGSILLIIADLLCRIIISPAELPIGLITSLLGAPFFLFLVYKIKEK